MPEVVEIPGFYYDAEKNRYFRKKGPIPGSSSRSGSRSCSSSSSAQKPNSPPTKAIDLSGTRTRMSKLLQVRELNGNLLSLTKGKCNFQEEFQKRLASQPVIWKYKQTNKTADAALEQVEMNVQTPEGQIRTDVLLAGSTTVSLSFFEVAKLGPHFDNAAKFVPDRVWPLGKENKLECYGAPEQMWRLDGTSVRISSSVSSITFSGKHSPWTTDSGSNLQHALITTLGSEAAAGSLLVLNLNDTFELDRNFSIMRRLRMHEITSFNCTIWTADCNSNMSQAVIGTNFGAALVDLERGNASWICHSKSSDVLAQQLDQSGNVVLCGFRNGAIVTVDVRERPQEFSGRPHRHRILYSPMQRVGQESIRRTFELRGNICPSQTIFMPSSVSCLQMLHLYDQYFLASSMDGEVKLFDHRITKRGAVQSYEGHVNSHSRIQLGVDQSERYLISGGEDCKMRIWSIKSGKLLFEDKFSDSVPSTVCWRRTRGFTGNLEENRNDKGFDSWGEAWVGTEEGLFLMHWP